MTNTFTKRLLPYLYKLSKMLYARQNLVCRMV